MKRILTNKEALIRTEIKSTDVVLDVGFWGQGTTINDPDWPHKFLLECAQEVYAFDLTYDQEALHDDKHYKIASAEDFDYPGQSFDVVFAGDLIEHLPNPGLFLDCSKKALRPGGRLIVSTPNAFNLWNLINKILRYEPTVNSDHTCYFNEKTITQLLNKQGWEVEEILYLYTLGTHYKESWKKKIQNVLYWALSKVTTKYLEPMVVIAKPIQYE